ncbi:hypothetical protein PC117_g19960 [Phytophthora cactorum]|uniref:BZIP domain-containing protein n=1 Tax=Phytophthora cactorum TaxID=29920 RepID=A0A8T1BQW9_9STRA|nr:hypothetical protein PC117_g19960 [Phytophthora cactorum]
MTLDATTIEQVEQFLTPFTLSTSNDIDERTGHEDPASRHVTASSKPRRRGRKKSNVDPVTKREMNRLKDRKRCSSYRQRQRNEHEGLHKEVRVLTAKLHTAKEETALSSGVLTTNLDLARLAQRTLTLKQASTATLPRNHG